jgi:hypothetical protein
MQVGEVSPSLRPLTLVGASTPPSVRVLRYPLCGGHPRNAPGWITNMRHGKHGKVRCLVNTRRVFAGA